MEILRINLSLNDNTHVKVEVEKSSVVGEGKTTTVLPFFDGNEDRWITIFKVLETKALEERSYEPSDFSTNAIEWMSKVGLLNEDQKDFSREFQKKIGQMLYCSLFPERSVVRSLLEKAISITENKMGLLHLQIKAEADAGHLASLFDYPWEMLHDGDLYLNKRQVSISRYIEYNTVPPALPQLKRLNVLLISSRAYDSENNLDQLPEEEYQEVRKSLEEVDKAELISLKVLKKATFSELGKYLTDYRGEEAPHVIHFDGHGLIGRRCSNPNCKKVNPGVTKNNCACGANLDEPEGYLLFENDADANRADYIGAKDLASELRLANVSDAGSQKQGVVLIVLSACQSGVSFGAESVFNGVAQSLIRERIPAVIGMQFSVSVEGAAKFSDRFYRSLSKRDSLLMAVTRSRVAMGGYESNQWYRPVLYLRWEDNEGGRLFADLPVSEQVGPDINGRKIVPIRRSRSTRVNKSRLPSVASDLSNSRKKVNKLANAQKSLQVVIDETFNKEKVIWQSHCGRVINAIKDVEKPVTSLLKALSEPDSFPIQPSRADKMRLENISADVKSLLKLLGTFNTICPPSSTEVKGKQYDKEREDISVELNRLIDNIKVITTSLILLF
jgi:hypothetical protein